ncbi:MAG: hypothetical protein GKR86_00040 [Ilumatobacter sp.]|nr:hypothetical protein [Ilumatobacter sp.]
MAITPGTVETYDNSVIREDLQEAFSMISPEECPFIQMAGTRSITNKQFDWPIVDLQAPDPTNRVIEGDSDVANDAATLAERIWNFSQISDKVVEVSHTSQAVDAAAQNVQRMSMQKTLKMKELKRDMEVMLLSNIPGDPGATDDPRSTAGFPAFLRTNADATIGATAPTLSAGTEGYPNAGWGDATDTRVFSEDSLNLVIEQCWNAGAEPTVIMLNGGNKRRLSSTFTGNSTRYKDAIDSRLVAAIDFYDSDFGDLTVVPNRFQPTLNALTDDDNYAVYIMDPEYYRIAYLDNVQSKPLAETGHSIRELIWTEYGLQVDNEAAHGIIPDTDNTPS